MKLFVPRFLATADAKVKITEGTNENGVPLVTNEFDLNCRFEQSNATSYTKEGQKVTLKGKAFVFEKFELFPDDTSGTCIIGGEEYDIVHASKKRNPDGSVNHLVLELI